MRHPTVSVTPSRALCALLCAVAALPLTAQTSAAPTTPATPAAAARPVDLAHDKNLYIVGYAHLDTQWRWAYPEVIRDFIRNTMELNFPLLEKYPDYIFNFTGSRRYEFMREYYPEEYARVKQYIQAGRWFPAGSSVDECDANVPSLESFARQFLYGNHFFQHEFGVQSDEFMLPDCFGFPASLPTVLAHGGIKGFSTQKLTWGSAVGIPFNIGTWSGPDGSTIVAALNPLSYGGSITADLSKSELWRNRIEATGATSGVFADYHYYGTGDRGGAPSEGSAQWAERSVGGTGPVRVISSRSDQMFRDITPEMAARLPNYRGELELTNHSAGSLSSEAYMKRWNRKNEQLANAAESASTAAWWFGAFPYPANSLYQAWDLVLGSQMHDILPGTSIPKAYEYSWNDEVLALNQFAAITERAAAGVLSALDTQARGTPVAVYNPLAVDREDPVEAFVPMSGAIPAAVTAYGPDGEPVPTQILARETGGVRVLFLAHAPSVGYAIYDIRAEQPPVPAATHLSVSAHALENDRYRVTVNDAGDIASIYDKTLQREMLSAPARLSIHTENPTHYPAWNMDWSDRELPTRSFVGGPATIRIVESGPTRVALEIERQTEDSVFIQTLRLAAGSAGERLEVLNRIDWRTREASLRADFPLAVANEEAAYDDKVGVVRRTTNNPKRFEMALQQWMDLTDHAGAAGVSILNDSKFGADKPDDHTLRLTLLYTPGVRGGVPDQGTQDQGRHDILYAFVSHRDSWIEAGTPWQAARLNQPLRAFLPEAHTGSLGRTFSLLSLSSAQAQVVAIKKAEDSNEVVVRVKELHGRPAAAISMHFPSAVAAAREVDAQERPIGDLTVNGGDLSFDLRGFGVRAFAVKLAAPPASVPAITSESVSLPFDIDVVASRAHRTDGAMDATGGSYPAELFPAQLQREGVAFQLGPVGNGAKNALTAQGQKIGLPAGNFNRVHLLVAAAGDTAGSLSVGRVVYNLETPNWTGFVGQWDNRVWDDATHVIGLTPGFTKRTPVAWFATHHNAPAGDSFYDFSYIFQASFNLPAGTSELTLPDNPKLRIFAVSVSHEPAATPAAAPLYDTLADHAWGGGPAVAQAGRTFSDATEVTLLPPLYHQPKDVHYTVDGREPTASSPVYTRPFFVSATTRVSARQIRPDGGLGPVTEGVVTVDDHTPPRLLDLRASSSENALQLRFSEPVTAATAADASNYSVTPALAISRAVPSEDGTGVTLTLTQPLDSDVSYTLSVRGVRDRSPQANLIVAAAQPFNAGNIIYRLPEATLPAGAVEARPAGLPINPADGWTMNILVRAEAKPKGKLLLAGFGQTAADGESAGASRYFAVFPDGIRFWYEGGDFRTNSPLDLGRWQMLTATYDGQRLTLYKDAAPIAQREQTFNAQAEALVSVGANDPWDHRRRFAGAVRSFTVRRGALSAAEVKALFEATARTP